jgi:hypothetical protein
MPTHHFILCLPKTLFPLRLYFTVLFDILSPFQSSNTFSFNEYILVTSYALMFSFSILTIFVKPFTNLILAKLHPRYLTQQHWPLWPSFISYLRSLVQKISQHSCFFTAMWLSPLTTSEWTDGFYLNLVQNHITRGHHTSYFFISYH